MSGECEICSEHTLDCKCKKKSSRMRKFEEAGLIGLQFQDTVEIFTRDLLDLIHWARRYCDYRCTYAPSEFNRIYDRIKAKYPDLKDQKDEILMNNGEFWPYAQDGNYDPKNGRFDARPLRPIQKSDFDEMD